MKLASYNIQYGFGADGHYDLERTASVVAGADVIALQEVERFWNRSRGDDQPEMLGRLLSGHYWVYGPALDMDASFRKADGRVVNRRRQFGTMILSRLPIAWSRLHLLPMQRMLTPLNTQNAALECLISTPAGPVRFFSIHLAHVGAGERLRQIEFLLERHRRAGLEGGPWSGVDDEPERQWTNGEAEPECPLAAIWMGDFNSEPGGAEYQLIVGDNPYHPGAAYAAGFSDAAILCADGKESSELFSHVKDIGGRARRRRLDYCFVGSPLAARVRSHRIDTGERASDHLPVFVEIDLDTPGGAAAR